MPRHALLLLLTLALACSRAQTPPPTPPPPLALTPDVQAPQPAAAAADATSAATRRVFRAPLEVPEVVPPATPRDEEAAQVLALKPHGKVTVLLSDGSTVEVPDGLTLTILRFDTQTGDETDPCLGTPHVKLDCQDCLCTKLKSGKRGLIPMLHLRRPFDGEPSALCDYSPWRVLSIELGGGDCSSSATWLLGPHGQRKLMAKDAPVDLSVYRDRLIAEDDGGTSISALPDAATALTSDVKGKFPNLYSASFAPDGTLWLRSNQLDGVGLGKPSVGRDTSVWRVVAGKPKRVLKTHDKVPGDYDCSIRPPEAVEFSSDGKRVQVDGKWRDVPP